MSSQHLEEWDELSAMDLTGWRYVIHATDEFLPEEGEMGHIEIRDKRIFFYDRTGTMHASWAPHLGDWAKRPDGSVRLDSITLVATLTPPSTL